MASSGSIQSLAEANDSLIRDGETGYVAKIDMASLIEFAEAAGLRITNIEGFVIAETHDDLQADLLWRYDIRLHRQYQPDADVVTEAAKAMLRLLSALDGDQRTLHFKIFAEIPPALRIPSAPPSAR